MCIGTGESKRGEHEGHEHLGRVLVGGIGVGELLGQVALLDRSRCRRSRRRRGRRRSATASSAPPPCRGRRRAGSRVDGVADQVVRATGYQLGVILACHRGAPVRPMCTRAQTANASPVAKRTSPRPARHGSVFDTVAPQGPGAEEDDHHGRDHRPDTQVAGPQDLPPLHGECREQPVDPEGRPTDYEEKLDALHVSDATNESRRLRLTHGMGSIRVLTSKRAVPIRVLPPAVDHPRAPPSVRSSRWDGQGKDA